MSATPIQLQDAASVNIATEDLDLPSFVGKCNAADLTKDIHGLLGEKSLRVYQIDKICFSGSHK